MSFLDHSIVCIGTPNDFTQLTSFLVVVQKDWKGLQESTYISRAFSDQGVRIRLRKEARNPAKNTKRVHDEYKEEEEEELPRDYRDGALSHSVQPANGYIKNEPEVAGVSHHTPQQFKRMKRSYDEHTSGEYDHYNNEQQWRGSASSSYQQPYSNGASLSSSSSVPLAVGMPGASTTAYVSSMAPQMNGAAASYVPAQFGAQTGYN
jgi:hypothetical protein